MTIIHGVKELADEAKWDALFAVSADTLEKLAAEAFEEYRAGRTEELGFDQLEFLPTVIRAEYLGDYRIRLAFNDGLKGAVDFSQWLDGPIFEPLRDPAYFQRFFLDGGTVAWPNGADVAPETLYERAKSSEAA